MKAVKLFKIRWNLEKISPEQRETVGKLLPTHKGMMVDDDFDVQARVPDKLKKKYGFDIIDFSFSEIRVIKNLEDLLMLCKPVGEKEKDLFNVMSGRISNYGKKCLSNLEHQIRYRLQLEKEGKDIWTMPTVLDEVMLGVENVSGLDWDGHTVEELMDPIKKQIRGISHTTKKFIEEITPVEEEEEVEDDVDEEEGSEDDED